MRKGQLIGALIVSAAYMVFIMMVNAIMNGTKLSKKPLSSRRRPGSSALKTLDPGLRRDDGDSTFRHMPE